MSYPLERDDTPPAIRPEPTPEPPAKKASDSGPATVILRDGTGRLLPGHRMGRPRGARNRDTRALREIFLEALDRAGGVRYLAKMARRYPEIFIPCLARMLPKEIAPNPEEESQITKIARALKALEDSPFPSDAPQEEAESWEP